MFNHQYTAYVDISSLLIEVTSNTGTMCNHQYTAYVDISSLLIEVFIGFISASRMSASFNFSLESFISQKVSDTFCVLLGRIQHSWAGTHVPVYCKQGTNVAHNIRGGLQIIAMFHL